MSPLQRIPSLSSRLLRWRRQSLGVAALSGVNITGGFAFGKDHSSSASSTPSPPHPGFEKGTYQLEANLHRLQRRIRPRDENNRDDNNIRDDGVVRKFAIAEQTSEWSVAAAKDVKDVGWRPVTPEEEDKMPPKRVCIVGSGNWGSAISMLVGNNAKANPELFEERVNMWVFEETVDGQKLTEIINTKHENVKYLPGHKLPENIHAVPDVVTAAEGADIFIFVIPHQFIVRALTPLKGKIKPTAVGISLIKGFEIIPTGGIRLLSVTISDLLGIPVSVLMGANLAPGVAAGEFCETTIGCEDKAAGAVFKRLFQTDNFRVVVVRDVKTVEVCGALKNVVASGAGFADGLELGDNTKSAIMRLGLMEMIKFAHEFYHGAQLATFFESCGVADLITTCYGGRNRRVAEAFVKTRKDVEELEKEILGGMKAPGAETAAEVNFMLKAKNMEDDFPLFTAVHKVFTKQMEPEKFIDTLRNHPEHMVDVKETV